MKSCRSLEVFVSNVLTRPVQAVWAGAVTEREQSVIDYIIAMKVVTLVATVFKHG